MYCHRLHPDPLGQPQSYQFNGVGEVQFNFRPAEVGRQLGFNEPYGCAEDVQPTLQLLLRA
jgi:hypothetical protein